MYKVPSRRGASAPKGLLLTCALSFIISSIPLAIVLFVYNPHIIKQQGDNSCIITPGIIANQEEIQVISSKYNNLIRDREIAAEEQRIKLIEQLKSMARQNSELREKMAEVTKNYTIENYECSNKLARAEHGFEESYRRFEIVQGYFDKCKDQTTRLGRILIDAEAEIRNCTKKLTHCESTNKKTSEKLIADRESAATVQGNTTTS